MEEVHPTRTELLIRKNQIGLAEQGRDLLKEKRDALLMEFMKVMDEAIDCSTRLQKAASAASFSLAIAKAVDGTSTLRSAAMATKGRVELEISGSSIMGIPIPEVEKKSVRRETLSRGYSVTGVSSRINETAECFEEEIDRVIEIAASETKLRRIGDEVQKTRRRVNALDYIVVPMLSEQVKYIQMALDEREREDLFRLKKVKKILELKKGVEKEEFPMEAIALAALRTKGASLSSAEYKTIKHITGPLITAEDVLGIAYGEIAEIVSPGDDGHKTGQVLETDGDKAVIQVFEGTQGVDVENTKLVFSGEIAKLGVSRNMMGRILNGRGVPIDGGGKIIAEKMMEITGSPINPSARAQPSDFIETGISTIDGFSTLLRGQKLCIFSGSGLSANELLTQVINQSSIQDKTQDFAIVIGVMGISHREASFFMNSFEKSGVLNNVVFFLNLADDPTSERLLTPRCVMTVAEYLAFENDMHVLVVLTDMANYCEALREVSTAREEVPGRRGYPGYMHTDMATIYERAGCIQGKKGSISQLVMLTVPDDDMTHPIADLSGYVTETQVILSRQLHRKVIYPPIDILPTPPRLRNLSKIADKTREDHQPLIDELYSAYARGRELRGMIAIFGEKGLSPIDNSYLKFADEFENRFVCQTGARRSIAETLDIGWDVISKLPTEVLRMDEKYIKKYHPSNRTEN